MPGKTWLEYCKVVRLELLPMDDRVTPDNQADQVKKIR